MLLLSMGVNKCTHEIREKLYDGLEQMRRDGLRVEMVEDDEDSTTFFSYHLTYDSSEYGYDFRKEVCAQLAITLSKLILKEMTDNLINRLVKRDYYDLTGKEQEIIANKVRENFSSFWYETEDEGTYKEIYCLLYEYLLSNQILNLDGYIRFRLKKYVKELENAIDIEVDSYILEKEYGAIIELLKETLNGVEPEVEQIQVLVDQEGVVKLFDSENNEMDHLYIRDFILGPNILEYQMNPDDMLICTLVTMAPGKIILHSHKETVFVSMLKDVFSDRLIFCKGCHLCGRGMKGLGK